MAQQSQLLPVAVAALVEDKNSQAPIVILHHLQSDRILPIWIGDAESRSIALALNNVQLERPLTHNLLQGVIKGMGGELVNVVIDRLIDKTYYASVNIMMSTKSIKIDARPSDSIALALTVGVPVFVEKEIMDKVGQVNPVRNFQPTPQEKKIEMGPGDVEKLRAMLEEARKREEKQSE